MSSLSPALQTGSIRPLTSAPSGWRKAVRTAAAQRSWVKLAVLALATLAIGWMDYVTGWEVSFSVLYALPVLTAVWAVGRDGGLFIAVFSGPVWWLANVEQNPYQSHWAYNWAILSREIYLVFIAIGGSAIRTKQQADAAQIQMLNEMRQLEKVIVSITEHEQQRIGRDLHDGLCQQLAAIGCATRALADDLTALGIPESADAGKIEEAIQQTVVEARSLARGIFPVHVDRSGLSAALAELGARTARLTGVPIQVSDGADVSVDDPEVAMHLYRIAQEAVANAVRHSGATNIVISLEATDNRLELRVDDDGKGIPLRDPAEETGMGLRTMQYRAQSIGADLSIRRRNSGGTSVICQLPIKYHEPVTS